MTNSRLKNWIKIHRDLAGNNISDRFKTVVGNFLLIWPVAVGSSNPPGRGGGAGDRASLCATHAVIILWGRSVASLCGVETMAFWLFAVIICCCVLRHLHQSLPEQRGERVWTGGTGSHSRIIQTQPIETWRRLHLFNFSSAGSSALSIYMYDIICEIQDNNKIE